MVVVRRISEIGAHVRLLEYDNLEGMILMSELSRRRIRSVNKLIRVGKSESVLVIRIDKDKDYIDLSKRRVQPEDVKQCEDRFIRSKTVFHIIHYAAEVMGIKNKEDFDHLMREISWKLHERFKSIGGAYEAFRRLIFDRSILNDSDITEEQKDIIINCVRQRLEPKKVKIRADVEVACYTTEGIEAVKAALLTGMEFGGNSESPIAINLIAPPVYMVSSVVLDRTEGLQMMTDVVEKIKTEIIAKGGHFNLKQPPKIMSVIDEAELTRRIEELEMAKDLVDGDEDYSGSDLDDDIDQEQCNNDHVSTSE